MSTTDPFTSLSRQQFRTYFQPSRIVLGVIPAATPSGVNVITLCFDMHCSYKPPMMAVAIHKINASYAHIWQADAWVLAVPGRSLVNETMFCGLQSGRDIDKVRQLDLKLIDSRNVPVPGIYSAIANIELRRVACFDTGDHVVSVGQVVRFAVNKNSSELPLLSIGPRTDGYTILARTGIHRIGVVET
jgi:flavin reductase (DIM6/NTAB) family NADH-FMN oxidoreductase RutF